MKTNQKFIDDFKRARQSITTEMSHREHPDHRVMLKALEIAELVAGGGGEELEWQDGISMQFDHNLLFGKGYCFDGMECLGEETLTSYGRVAIWPDKLSSGKWNYYNESNGGFQPDFESREAVKLHVLRHHLMYPAQALIDGWGE